MTEITRRLSDQPSRTSATLRGPAPNWKGFRTAGFMKTLLSLQGIMGAFCSFGSPSRRCWRPDRGGPWATGPFWPPPWTQSGLSHLRGQRPKRLLVPCLHFYKRTSHNKLVSTHKENNRIIMSSLNLSGWSNTIYSIILIMLVHKK